MPRAPSRALINSNHTQAELAALVGVHVRSVRQWLTYPDNVSHRVMSEPARRLLILIERIPEHVIPILESMQKKGE